MIDVRGREDGGVLIGDEPSRGVTPASCFFFFFVCVVIPSAFIRFAEGDR